VLVCQQTADNRTIEAGRSPLFPGWAGSFLPPPTLILPPPRLPCRLRISPATFALPQSSDLPAASHERMDFVASGPRTPRIAGIHRPVGYL